MHWQELLDTTRDFGPDTAYTNAMGALQWGPPQVDMGNNIPVIEKFLKAWNSLRVSWETLPKFERELSLIWANEIELYAKALKGESLEQLDVNKVVDFGVEKMRVGVAIEHMYATLLTVEGVNLTNASKILHLRLPNLIVMTDAEVRRMWGNSLFSSYRYAFTFLRAVRHEMEEAINTLSETNGLSRTEAIEELRNAHGRRRSLAKLADEYYYTWTR